MNFLFWNIKANDLPEVVGTMVEENEIDVLALVECEIPMARMLEVLNAKETEFHPAPSRVPGRKISVYTRFTSRFVTILGELGKMSVWHIRLPGIDEILFAVAHLPSKLYVKEHSQIVQCMELATSIGEIEDEVGHSRTILVGDLNMNPFESGMVMAGGLHAVMCRRIASRGSRTVDGKEYPFFYNPVWGRFADISPGAPGTYYYRRAEHETYFWNVFDQVLLRPALANRFNQESLRILDSFGETKLTGDSGIPRGNDFSDHLPIVFSMSL